MVEALEKGVFIAYKDYGIVDPTYYEEIGNEKTDFRVAYLLKRPLSLIGPTGCGKTTLAMHMAYELGQDFTEVDQAGNIAKAEFTKAETQDDGKIAFPYIEVPCHEDLTETHLVGRYGLQGEWLEGPLYTAATNGGIVVLDEIVEARKDVTVLVHGLTDDRRVLHVPKKGGLIKVPDNFMLVICYNPGYQIKQKDLKPSTRQRFPTITLDYPIAEKEMKIVMTKTGVEEAIAEKFVTLANEIRSAKANDNYNLQEGASTRLLIMAAESYLKHKELDIERSLTDIARTNIINPITTEETDIKALETLLEAL